MKDFKPFDKVAVLSESDGNVYPDIYQRVGNEGHHVLGCRYLIKDANIKPYPKTANGKYMDPEDVRIMWETL